MFYYLFIVKGKNILVIYIIKKNVNLFVKWWGYLRKYMDLKNIFNFGFE